MKSPLTDGERKAVEGALAFEGEWWMGLGFDAARGVRKLLALEAAYRSASGPEEIGRRLQEDPNLRALAIETARQQATSGEKEPQGAGGPGRTPFPTDDEGIRERLRKRAEEINRSLEDPEFRRKLFQDPLEARLDRLIEIGEEIEGALKSIAGEVEPAPGPADLPEGPMLLGRVAGTDLPFRWDPWDLRTHMLIAGEEGSGKTVAASVVVEEALRNRVPVVVFDPTGWWSGLLHPNRDEAHIKRFPGFGLKVEDARGFPCDIRRPVDPDARLDPEGLLKPGLAVVFHLVPMQPGDYDRFVTNSIDALLQRKWEETPGLKLLLVLDDIHRLLEKYGGHGGYLALEKGARELRSRGVGMVMTSRTWGHFRDEMRGNVLMEVQMRTGNPVDLEWMRAKFGEEYEEAARELTVGEGLVSHPKFNRGRPVHVRFRPPLHQPGGLPQEDLETYRQLSDRLDGAERVLAGLREKGVDTADIEPELWLARHKLEHGHFRMAEVYLESLRTSLQEPPRKGDPE